MADLKKLAEELVNLTVKDVKELADILKEEYGIEPAAAAVAVAAPACEAAVTGNRDLAVTALNMNLLCQIDHDANIVIDELIEAHKDYLPQFKQS